MTTIQEIPVDSQQPAVNSIILPIREEEGVEEHSTSSPDGAPKEIVSTDLKS